MTPETLTTITREAEERYAYSAYDSYGHQDRQGGKIVGYIEASTIWAEKVEAIRAEIQQKRDSYCFVAGNDATLKIHDLDGVLSIIDKHLNL